MRLLHFRFLKFLILGITSCTATVVGTGTPPPGGEDEPASAPSSQPSSSTTPPVASSSSSESTPPNAPTVPAVKVTGQWQGKIVEANDSIYLDLTQTPDGFVTGKMCEAPPNKDCNVIANGTFDGKELAFGVSWAENGNVETVDVDFEITGGGNALTGYVTSTKCNNCKYTAQLLKQ